LWLVDNNHPLREFENPAFRTMIQFANLEAEAALWVSRTSVATFVIRLYRFIQPVVVTALSQFISKIHISSEGWSTKGGKRGFYGIVAHFADESGVIRDLPIDLPQLRGVRYPPIRSPQTSWDTLSSTTPPLASLLSPRSLV
jgi:hypothetical protein